jgi:choline dehydrogenase-like flavoprotein
VIIVGAGPAGITTALELRGSGLRIALIESGDVHFDPDTQALYEGESVGHDATDLVASRLRMFGGTSNHWGGHCLPLDAIDFARSPFSGLSGWPISRDDLLPYYQRANSYMDLGALDYSRALTPALGDDAFLLPDDPRITSVVARGSGPKNFGTAYHDLLNRSPDVAVLKRLNVTNIAYGTDGRVIGVDAQPLDGDTQRIEGRAVVIAAGAIESARLLMLSNDGQQQRLGDAGDMVGRCYMDHPSGGAAFLHFAQPSPPLAYWSELVDTTTGKEVRYALRLSDDVLAAEGLANSHYYLVPFAMDAETRERQLNARTSIDALRSLVKWGTGRSVEDLRLSDAYCDFITNADSFVVDRWMSYTGQVGTDRVLLRYEVEQQPTLHNRITLSGGTRDALGLPRITLNWAPDDTARDTIVRTMELFGQYFGAAGVGRIEIERHFDEPFFASFTSWHQLGTLRMAASPRDGVVDPDCRVHGSANLFVAGGAVMPTVGRANPTLTIVALAIRLSDHLKTQGVLQ